MKKLLYYLFLISIVVFVYFNKEQVVKFALDILYPKETQNFDYRNNYYLKYKYKFVDELKDFKLENKKELFNIYYTITNNGYNTYKFYCPDEYKTCLDDIENLVFDQKNLSVINGFVHPYNSFQNIRTKYNSIGEVDVEIIKTYSEDDISKINEKVNEIVKNVVKDEKNTKKIIKLIHDYIINNTKYDKDRADKNIIKYKSNTAYGVLFEGFGICGGYTDTMAIFLNYYDIPNFEIASENHIWNAVYIDGEWLHLDLTWDDPVLSSGEEVLSDTYFLITTEKLKELNDSQHNFDENVYQEVTKN